jgi:hypothetical protein
VRRLEVVTMEINENFNEFQQQASGEGHPAIGMTKDKTQFNQFKAYVSLRNYALE